MNACVRGCAVLHEQASVIPLAPHEFFHALSDLTRLRCLALLHEHGEVCVCELTRTLGVSQPKISRHLALLRDLGLVQARRAGVWIHYSITPKLPAWSCAVLDAAMPAFRESAQGQDDLRAWHAPKESCSVDY